MCFENGYQRKEENLESISRDMKRWICGRRVSKKEEMNKKKNKKKRRKEDYEQGRIEGSEGRREKKKRKEKKEKIVKKGAVGEVGGRWFLNDIRVRERERWIVDVGGQGHYSSSLNLLGGLQACK
jgi:hypothetical protein